MAGMFDDIPVVGRVPPGAAPPQQPPPQMVDVGYGPGVRPPDANTGRGVSAWLGSPYASAPTTGADGGWAPPQAYSAPPPEQLQQQPPQQPAPAAAPPGPPQGPAGMFDDIPVSSAGGDGQGPDMHAHGDVGAWLNNSARSMARGVPVLGAAADEANAATNALVGPFIERHFLDKDPNHDRKWDIGQGLSLPQRYAKALAMQRGTDAAWDQDHPNISTAEKGVGMGASLLGGALVAPAALAPTSSMLSQGAGLIPRIAAGAVDGSILGGAQGYLEGDGGLTDLSRLSGAGMGAAGGAAFGGAFPVAGRLAGAAWNASGRRLADALIGQRMVQRPLASEAQRLAAQLNGDAPPAAGINPEAPANPAAPGGTLPDAIPVQGPGPVTEIPPPTTQTSRDELEAALTAARRSPLKASPSDVSDAYSRLGRAADRMGMTPQEMADMAMSRGPLGVLADTGGAGRDLLRSAVNRPGRGGDIAFENLGPRQQGVFNPDNGEYEIRPSSMRILDNAAEGMRLGDRQFHTEFDVLNATQKRAADPLYAQVRELGPVNSPKLEELAVRPSVKRAMVRAYRLAQEDGRNPEGLGLNRVEVPGAWDSQLPPEAHLDAQRVTLARGPSKAPSQGKSLLKFVSDGGGISDAADELQATGAHKWHVGKAFQKALTGNGGSLDDWALRAWESGYFPETGARPTEREMLDAMAAEMRGKPRYAREADMSAADRMRLRDEADEMVYRGGTGDHAPAADDYTGRPAPQDEPAWEAQPTAETWDYIKRGLDDELTPYREGKKAWDSEARGIVATLDQLRGELVRINPVYGQALQAYAGPAAMKDALSAGRAFMREDAPDLGRQMGEMTAGERQMYRLGALQGLKDRLGDANVTFDAANKAGLLKPNQLERFRQLFPTTQEFATFIRKLEAEKAMHDTHAATFGNSTTAKQLLNAMEPNDPQAEGAQHAAHSVVKGDWLAVLKALNKLGVEAPMREGTAETVASILTSHDQSQFPTFVRRMSDAQRASHLADVLARTGRAGGAYGAAATVDGASR